jgi:hypothetical protein
MTKTNVSCNGCGKDLSSTSNSEDYRIVLKSECIPCHGGVVTDMAMYPQIEKPMHFCSIECLKRRVALI